MSESAAANAAMTLALLAPMGTAITSLLLGRGFWRHVLVGLAGSALTLLAAMWLIVLVHRHDILVMQLGGWRAPHGISFVADRFSALVVLLASLIGLCGVLFATPTLVRRRVRRFVPLLHFMVGAMSAFFLAGDIFNFYVWFELVLVASFGLLVLDERRRAIEGAVKYFALNIVGSMLLLAGVGLLYAMTGTLNMADLTVELHELNRPGLVTAVGSLFLVALGIKSAAFPLFFWLPASYPTPPIAVIAVFGGMLTKVGVYGMVRLFTLIFTHDIGYTHDIILVAGSLTMAAGVLGAVAQHDLRRLLSFHIISQIGYMLMGLGLHTVLGLRAVVVFMAHIVVTKAALFFVSGVIYRLEGSYKLERLGGLYAGRPALAALFLVPALSLSGIPPLSGFPAKLSVVQAGLASEQNALVATALAVGLLTLYSMSKIWTQAFWSPRPEKQQSPPPRREGTAFMLWAPPVLLAVLVVAMGLAAGPLLAFADRAAMQLIDREAYIEAVLEGGPRREDSP